MNDVKMHIKIENESKPKEIVASIFGIILNGKVSVKLKFCTIFWASAAALLKFEFNKRMKNNV